MSYLTIFFYLTMFVFLGYYTYSKKVIRDQVDMIDLLRESVKVTADELNRQKQVKNFCYYIYYYTERGSRLHCDPYCRHLGDGNNVKSVQLSDDLNAVTQKVFCTDCYTDELIHKLDEFFMVSSGKIHGDMDCHALRSIESDKIYSVYMSTEQQDVMEKVGGFCARC